MPMCVRETDLLTLTNIKIEFFNHTRFPKDGKFGLAIFQISTNKRSLLNNYIWDKEKML